MGEETTKIHDLNNTILTNLLLITIAGLLIIITVEIVDIIDLLERCKKEKCHRHPKEEK